MAPLYGWGSTASRLQPLRGGSLHGYKYLKSHFKANDSDLLNEKEENRFCNT